MSEIVGLKPRTLQRLLADNQTSYRELMDFVRFEQARKLLEEAELNLFEVARLTGYTDSSNFARAFRRLSARSPAEYRNDQVSGRGFGTRQPKK
jgi:AraC-like DNA-binding protein